MNSESNIFVTHRRLGYVSNHIPLQVRYIKSRQENLITTCVGNAFHTYGVSHFSLLSVGSLHPSDITCLASDTYHIYTSCGKHIYAYRRGTELKHTYTGHDSDVKILLPFGIHLISVDIRSNLKVWDIKNETCFLELSFNNFEITTCIHPNTYINKILLGSTQGSLQLWNINTSKLIYTFSGWGELVTILQGAPAIDIVAVGLASGKICLHNLKYDKTIMEFIQDWGAVTSIGFRTDNTSLMLTGSTSGHIVLWDLNKKCVASQLLQAHEDSVTGLTCLPNEPLMVTSSPDNSLKLWIFDMPGGGPRLLKMREGHSMAPTKIRFHGENGHNILSSGGDSTLRIFNTGTEQFNKSFGKPSYNRKGSKKRGRIHEDDTSMPPIVEFTSETTREKEWDNIVAIHANIPLVTTWTFDKIKMGELKIIPEKVLKKNNLGTFVEATCITLTHCGNFIVVGYSTGDLERFNIQSGIWKCSYGSPKAHPLAVRGVATDLLNQMIISGGADSWIKFWKFHANEVNSPIKAMELCFPIVFFKLQRESSLLAVALEDFSVFLIDTDALNIIRKFENNEAQLTDVTFTPDSRWLIIASMDCTIKTWDIPTTYLIDKFQVPSACISLDMSPCGDILATAHINELGITLWCNKTIYEITDLKALTEINLENDLCKKVELVSLSGLPSSRWQNLINLETIKLKNKPKFPPKAPISPPFFLPTIPGLNIKFKLTADANNTTNVSKICNSNIFPKLSPIATLLQNSIESNNFIFEKLKSLPPSALDYEISSLNDYGDESVTIILKFLKMCESMLKSFKDFELVNVYFAMLLKYHGELIAYNKELEPYLSIIDHSPWHRLQGRVMYCLSIIRNKLI